MSSPGCGLTLAIATATAQVSVAVAGPDGLIGAVFLRAGRRHGETLAPAIQSLAALAGVGMGDLDRIAVDTGPGLFTGLRVGVATAKALASALALPVVACSSLDLLAHPHRHLGRPVASAVDARRGEIFWALYQPGEGGMTAVTSVTAAAPAEAASALSDVEGVLLTGDGARRWFADGPVGGRAFDVLPAEYDHPSASVLAEMAPDRPAQPPEKITANYQRGADVRIGWERR
jgi:tRNA threonylcarbamoyladenosine biosynthesis protein TsaB